MDLKNQKLVSVAETKTCVLTQQLVLYFIHSLLRELLDIQRIKIRHKRLTLGARINLYSSIRRKRRLTVI